MDTGHIRSYGREIQQFLDREIVFVASDRVERRLAAILAADMVGYSRHMEVDEAGTIARQRAHRTDLIDPKVATYKGRIVKTTGDGMLVEFASAVDAVECAVDIQRAMGEREAGLPDNQRILYRIGINVGDIVIDGDDILGDGVNVAARLEGLATPGGIAISNNAHEQTQGKLDVAFEDGGDHEVKNIARPLHVWLWQPESNETVTIVPDASEPLALPDKPSIAVLPFDNMSGDPAQDFLADGVVEAITAALSRIRSFFVIARNSAFTFQNRVANAVDIGRELGVAYLLEGSVQKAGDRIRITVQLIETGAGAHIWAEHYDGSIEEIFDLQDRITERVAGQLQPSIRLAEIERSRGKRPHDQGAYDYTMRAMPHVWALEKEESSKALDLLDQALAIDPVQRQRRDRRGQRRECGGIARGHGLDQVFAGRRHGGGAVMLVQIGEHADQARFDHRAGMVGFRRAPEARRLDAQHQMRPGESEAGDAGGIADVSGQRTLLAGDPATWVASVTLSPRMASPDTTCTSASLISRPRHDQFVITQPSTIGL